MIPYDIFECMFLGPCLGSFSVCSNSGMARFTLSSLSKVDYYHSVDYKERKKHKFTWLSAMIPKSSKFKTRLTEVILAVTALVVFLYYVEKNIQVYLQSCTVFTGSLGTKPYTPPVTVCSHNIPLSPIKLLDFGLELSTENYSLALLDYQRLKGVPNDTPLVQLFEHARLPLGHFVKEVALGTMKEVYDIDANASMLWEFPIENIFCYALKPLPINDSHTLTIQFRNRSEIPIYYNNKIKEKDLSNDSVKDSVMHILEENISFKHYISSKYEYSIENSILPFEPILNRTYFKVQSYSVHYVKIQEGHLIEECHNRCYKESAEKQQLCFQKFPTQKDGLQKTCKLSFIFNSAEKCRQKCGFQNFREYWCITEEDSNTKEGTLTINVSQRHKVFSQKKCYPAFKFYSDIGGCLGLFLGASLLSCFAWIKSFLETVFHKFQKTWHDLASSSVYLFLLVLLVTHTILSVVYMIENNGQIFVTLVPDDLEKGQHENGTDVILKPNGGHAHHASHNGGGAGSSPKDVIKMALDEALVERWATRPFGCRVPSPVDSFTQCLLKDQGAGVFGATPFVSIDDLPICRKSLLGFPVFRFAVPSYVLAMLGDTEHVEKCIAHRKHTGCTMSRPTSKYRFKVEFMCGTHFSGAFVEFGGIFGLYLGLSFSYFLRKLLFHDIVISRLKQSTLKVVEKIIMMAVGIMTIAICGYQLYVYLYCHLVTQSTQTYPLEGKQPISATICHWPPINTNRLLEVGGITFTNDSNFDDTLSTLASEFAMNATFFQDAWSHSLWTLQETQNMFNLTEDRIRGNWEITHLLGYKCFKLTYKRYDAIYSFNKSEFTKTQQFVSFHSPKDKPQLYMYFKPTDNFVGVISKLSDYLTLANNQSDRQYGLCIDRCNQEYLSNVFQCDMPVVENSFEGTRCNKSFILDLLKWSFQAKLHHHHLYPFMSYNRVFEEECKARCRKHPKAFLEVNGQPQNKAFMDMSFTVFVNKSVVVYLSHDLHSKEVTTEFDGYALSQMISQMGGAVGIVIGASLLSVMRMVFGFD